MDLSTAIRAWFRLDAVRGGLLQISCYWQYMKTARTDLPTILAKSVSPCPAKSDRISDKPPTSRRAARCGMMGRYMDMMMGTPIIGMRGNCA